MKALAAIVLLLAASRLFAGEPLVLDLWPGKVPDEPAAGVIGPERIRMSPGLDRTQVEVTNKTRLITGVTQPSITIYPAPADKNMPHGALSGMAMRLIYS